MSSCKVILKDEVNVKIENLDLDTRKALVKKFKYEDPTARFRPSYKLGRWDGAVSFFGLGGTTYMSMLAQVFEEIENRNIYIEVEDQRTSPKLEFDLIDEEFWGDLCWPDGHQMAGQPIRLRDYQVEIINKFLENPQCIQEVATGAGKTITTATLSKICEKYGRTIVIVPNKSLVEQTEEDFINCQLDVGVYYGDRKNLNKTHTICTWQSLNILDKRSHDDDSLLSLAEFLEGVSTVIVDEVHMAKADVLKKILTQNLSNAPIRWGLTGTIPEEEQDQISLLASVGPNDGDLFAHELQERGVLAQCHVNVLQTRETVKYNNYQEELKFLTTDTDRIKWMAKMISAIAESGNTLILCDRLETGKALEAIIKDSVFVSGAVKTKDRKAEYDNIAISDGQVLIATYGVAAVGINVPRLFNLVLIEPGKSFVRVIQSIGRGLRKADDKDFVQIWDMTSTCKFSAKHLTKRKQFYTQAKYPFTIEKIDRTLED